MKPHEIELASLVDKEGRIPSAHWDTITKQQYRTLEKWSRKLWWDSGVSLRSGWLTELGRKNLGPWTKQT